MNPDYALLILKEDRILLSNSLAAIEEVEKSEFIQYSGKMKTKLKHEIGSLDFAIEVLETWED